MRRGRFGFQCLVIGWLLGGGTGGVTGSLEAGYYHLAREGVEVLRDQALRKGTAKATPNGASSARYGEEGVGIMISHGGRGLGPEAAEVIRRYGTDAKRVIEKHGEEGLLLLQRSGDELMPLVREHGDAAVEVCLKHPGVGEALINRLGERGIRLGREMTTEEAIRLTKQAGRWARAGRLHAFRQQLGRQGGRAIRVAERHPKTIIGGSAVAYLLTHPERLGDLTSEGLRGLLAAANLDPAQRPLAAVGFLLALAALLVSPLYLLVRRRGRGRRFPGPF